MSQDLTNAMRSTVASIVVFKNLPDDVTNEEQAADLLYEKLRINVDPAYLSVKGNTCMAVLTRYSIANCFNTLLKSHGMFCEPQLARGHREKLLQGS